MAKRFEPADEQLALQIAAYVYPGAETELTALLDDLRNGRPVKLQATSAQARWPSTSAQMPA
jgi:hypothetical protein